MHADRRRTQFAASLLSFIIAFLVSSYAVRAQLGLSDTGGSGEVRAIRLVAEKGGRVDWSQQGDWIAYDRPDFDGYSKLYIARPDGGDEQCLTCLPVEFRKRHAGNVTWHPSGDWLVFQVEKPFAEGGVPYPFLAIPGRNRGDDLWAISRDGRTFVQLTARGEQGGRSLAPNFSHEGDQLVWSERIASGGGPAWGQWVLRVARFKVGRGLPSFGRVRSFEPGAKGFYESYGFTTDDKGILFASDLSNPSAIGGLDLHILRLESEELASLTHTANEWDRFASLSPNGRKVVWASSRELGTPTIERRDRVADLPLDLWLMNADGRGAERLTKFNDPTSDQYAGEVTIRSTAWSPAGDRVIVSIAPVGDSDSGSLYLLELASQYGR